jgi:putative PIN family toxin of toxin-antitoxin system
LRIVLDTNVVVSGLLNPYGHPGRLLDLVLEGWVTLLVDDRIFAEYEVVLRRPKFGFGSSEVGDFLDYVEAESSWIRAKPLIVSLPDPYDLPFLEVAVAGFADSLVTGNVKHFPRRSRRACRIETPAQLIGRFAREGGR